MIGGTWYFSPSKEELKKQHQVEAVKAAQEKADADLVQNTTTLTDKSAKKADSLPGLFSAFSGKVAREVTVETEKLIIHLSTHGGSFSYVELKDYKTFDGKPVVLRNSQNSEFSYKFGYSGTNISTADLDFNTSATNLNLKGTQSGTVTFDLPLAEGKMIRQSYTFSGSSYMIDHQLVMDNMGDVVNKQFNYIDVSFKSLITRKEKDLKISRDNTTIYYRSEDEKPDYLSETKDVQETIKTKSQWVSFKEQFFAQTLISKEGFIRGELNSLRPEGNELVVKNESATMTLPYNHAPNQTYHMQLYFGPLHYGTLSKFDLDLERQIPIGWSFFLTAWVNRFIIIPIFNTLSNFISNYGIIILILTLVIKLITLPFTYKSYLSTAKMKLLKPELDAIKAKFGDDMQRQQQETMKIYKQAGVSPFGGCLPLLFQFPILISMFRFFPSSIELRQQAFLWAKDLSTYDSVYDFGHVPSWFNSVYGDHVSLFTLLMTVSTIAYSYYQAQSQPTQQKEMQWMSYVMPLFFLGLFNKYSAGLSLYYFVFNMMTFAQQYLFKLFVDEKKLHAQIELNRKKPQVQKTSKFQQKLQDIAKQQQARQQQAKGGAGAAGARPKAIAPGTKPKINPNPPKGKK